VLAKRSREAAEHRGHGDVSLCVRLRPGAEEQTCVQVKGASTVCLSCQPSLPNSEPLELPYSCDHAFGPETTQEEVYAQAVSPICEGVLLGYNGAVIAYGQTGSGKTHTIIGSAREGSRGVAPQAVSHIFAALFKRQSWTVEVSVLEIYNEKVRDLIATRTAISSVDIHEACNKNCNGLSFHCPGATRRKVIAPEEALMALSEGMRRRETARTDMNQHSSRSHLVFTLTVVQTDPDVGATLRGRLHIVDLAGSERLKRSMASEYSGVSTPTRSSLTPRAPRDQRREAGEINKSLSQLALVIQRLTGPKKGGLHLVPYRDSMLTRLLAESFGGSSKTCLIITCSSLERDREETRCTLEFGKRAKLVKNNAEINLEVTHEVTPVVQALIQKELGNLQREKEEMLREREAFVQERNDLQAQLVAAASDAARRHQLHINDVRRLEDEKEAMRLRWEESVRQNLATVLSESRQLEELRRARSDALEAERCQIEAEWEATLKRPSFAVRSSHRPKGNHGSCVTDSLEACSTADTSVVEDGSDVELPDSPPSFDALTPVATALKALFN